MTFTLSANMNCDGDDSVFAGAPARGAQRAHEREFV
jgi:hypothetical protein